MVKKTVARALQWFVRDQIAFNRETVSALEAIIEALNEHNRALVSLAGQTNDARSSGMRSSEVRELKDIRSHWIEWRADWERKAGGQRDSVPAQRRRSAGRVPASLTLMESNFREIVKAQHADYLGALDRTTSIFRSSSGWISRRFAPSMAS